MSNVYINEPLTQKLPPFYNFMGGMSGLIKSYQRLKKLLDEPRHWRGTKIEVQDANTNEWLSDEVQATVYQDDILVYCNHANQEIEPVTFYDGTDNEYTLNLSVCQKCGAGWDEDGGQRLEEL